MYQQVYDPIAHSIGFSASFAAIPLIVLFALLGVFRAPARWAALCALIASMVVAVTAYGMPLPVTANGAAEGAAIGFFPIIWIGINAIWLFKLTQASGHADVLRRSLARVSSDQRVQAILIAFCFGALLESLAGGGAPVAICAVMLISIGVQPVKAAAICLLADTSPVAFGSLGLPISVLSKVTGLPVHELGVMVGRQTPMLALFVPCILVLVADGRRGLREVWPLALVAGLSFAATQCAGSMLLPIELVDIVSALICTGTVLTFLRVWSPAVMRERLDLPEVARSTPSRAQDAAPAMSPAADSVVGADTVVQIFASGGATAERECLRTAAPHTNVGSNVPPDTSRDIARALAPYGTVIALVALMQVGVVGRLLGTVTSTFRWPGLEVVTPAGIPVAATAAKFEWLASAGSIVLIAGIIAAPILGLSWRVAARTYRLNLHELRWAVFTVCCVVGVAYVMNLSGQIVTLGIWAANAGPAFAFVSPILGWVATGLTGSDTSANALFGVLQITTAHHTGLSDILLAAANSSGGVVGKAVSPQNLTIAAVAVGMSGQEGLLLRRVFGWTIAMIAAMSVLVFLQSTAVLGWTVP